MDSENFEGEQVQRIDDGDAVATPKKFVKLSPIAQLQQEDSAIARFQKYLDDSPLQKQAEQTLAKLDTVVETWQLRHLAAAEAEAAAKLELRFAGTAAAQKYLEEQAIFWNEMANASRMVLDKADTVTPEPLRHTIKARIPKVRISAQAKQEHVPAPAVEPKIEMPPVHWLASMLDFLLTKGAFKRTVEPILVDIYDEYCEAIRRGDERRAKWIVVRGCLLVIWGQIERPLRAFAGWIAALRGG